MIVNAESALIQPVDRDYKQKGSARKVHLEVKNNGISHALRVGGQTMVLIESDDCETEDNPIRKYEKRNADS